MFDNLGEQIYRAVVTDDRWTLYLKGLGATLFIALVGVVIGVAIGSLVGIGKVNAAQNKKMRWVGVLCDIYLTIIRGTPMVIQLLIMYYIIFAGAPIEAAMYVAMLAFGVNSGAYVAEIIRAGINAVPIGQTEAGRSLGLSRSMTMRNIVMPQAIKNILPALGNEFIVLFKETAIVGYVAVTDLTRAAELIRSRTYQPFVPLILSAIIYLVIVMVITYFLRRLERRLSKSDAR